MVNETISNDTFVEPNPHQVSQPNAKKNQVLSLAGPSERKKRPDQHLHTPEKSTIFKTPRTQVSKNQAIMETLKEIENLEISNIKKSGTFLDGCKVCS
jgi:hypothetical protein